MSISSLGLPDWARAAYERRGVKKLYDWQRECIHIPGVLAPDENGKFTNLLYSSPTSGGKTLVSEIALIRRLAEGGVGLFVLPFVSVVTEKEKYFTDLCKAKKLRVFSFYGGSVMPVSVLVNDDATGRVGVCTMEKANIIVNFMLESGQLKEKLKILVIDEFHTLGDPHRGYLLDVLVAKVLSFAPNCQIVAMSATLPNLKALASWIRGVSFSSNFRPVPLKEMLITADKKILREIRSDELIPHNVQGTGVNGVLTDLVKEVLNEGHSVLVFCPTKQKCEDIAKVISRSLLVTGGHGARARHERERLIAELRVTPGGLDKTLEETVPDGIAFHHSGLTVEERSLIETAYREGVLLCLAATSTLGAGVNLSTRRVIFSAPRIAGEFIDTAKYRQMAGRAGRAGQGTYGESIVICTNEGEAKQVLEMARKDSLPPLVSALDMEGLQRLILDVLSVRTSLEAAEVHALAKNTFRWACVQDQEDINKAISFLVEKKLIESDGDMVLRPTLQGRAISASGLDCAVGAEVIEELQRVRKRGINLESDLHLVFLLVTAEQGKTIHIKWDVLRECFELVLRKWPEVIKLMDLADKQGILYQAVRLNKFPVSGNTALLKLFQRFYTACILWSLLSGDDVTEIALRTGIPRGSLQGLRGSSGSLAASVATICHKMRWVSLEAIIDSLSRRLLVGAGQAAALAPLMQIAHMTLTSAQQLYIHGIFSPGLVARLRVEELADILRKGTSTLPTSEAEKILKDAQKTAKRLRRIANEEAKLKQTMENPATPPRSIEGPACSPSPKRRKTQKLSEGLRRVGGVSLTAAGTESARRTSEGQDQVYRVSLGSARGDLTEKQPLLEEVQSVKLLPLVRAESFKMVGSFEEAVLNLGLINGRILVGGQIVGKPEAIARLFIFPNFLVNIRTWEEIAKVLERPDVLFACEDVKSIFHQIFSIRGINFHAPGVIMDMSLARHLMDPDSPPTESQLVLRWESIRKPLRVVHQTSHAHVGAVRAYLMSREFLGVFNQEQVQYMLGVDMRMLEILARMEFSGIRVRPWTGSVEIIVQRLGEIQAQVRAMSNRDVNLDSPEDVAVFLYDDLGFPDSGTRSGKKTGHRTTDHRALEKLPGEKGRAVAKLISEFRKLRGVLSNAETLGECVRNGRVHANFSLSDTGTGRLTVVKGPNLLCLENSFVSDDKEISIRQMLIADEGQTLISVDYCQIEVRVLAHFSQDQKLLDIVNTPNSDIFTEIVRLWKSPYKTDPAVVAQERAGCKKVVYGLIYGMGIKAMAADLGVSEEDAEAMKKQFFDLCPSVEPFIKRTVRETEARGFVDSLAHRRRLIHGFGRGKREKASAERQAINTLCQASAADIIKVAMIRIDRIFTTELRHTNARILLQIHDELLIQCSKDHVEVVRDVVAREMTRNVLDVALEVKWAFGPSWGELSEVNMPYK